MIFWILLHLAARIAFIYAVYRLLIHQYACRVAEQAQYDLEISILEETADNFITLRHQWKKRTTDKPMESVADIMRRHAVA